MIEAFAILVAVVLASMFAVPLLIIIGAIAVAVTEAILYLIAALKG